MTLGWVPPASPMDAYVTDVVEADEVEVGSERQVGEAAGDAVGT